MIKKPFRPRMQVLASELKPGDFIEYEFHTSYVSRIIDADDDVIVITGYAESGVDRISKTTTVTIEER
jgi:hypothetical protein